MIPPGYKHTEVGVIPEEWEVKTLGDLATIATGNTPPTSDPSNYGDEFPFVGPVDMGDNKFVSRTEKMLSRKGFAMSRRFPKDSILFVCIGSTIGKCGIAPVELTSNQQINAIFPSTTFAVDFLFYSVCAAAPRIRSQAGEQAVPIVNKSQFAENIVALPPLPEQRAIATALSDVDGLLGGLDRLIAKKRDLKQASMQQLLTGQTRLPGFKGEWVVTTLFDLADRKKELFDDGDWIESEHITTEGIRLIQTGNIGVGSFIEKDTKKYIYEKSFTTLRCKQLRQGDLLVCRLADPAGRACVLPEIGEERVVTSVDVTIFRPPSEVANRVFLSNIFSTPEWFRHVSDRSGGTTHKRISRGALGRIAINLPPLPEQTAIATILSDMDAELAALEQRRDKTRALKQGMMQELLTGRTRLI